LDNPVLLVLNIPLIERQTRQYFNSWAQIKHSKNLGVMCAQLHQTLGGAQANAYGRFSP
jgi:hypothetical protein